MYESFFGLRERPFSLSPDPRFLYMTPSHREALGNLTYGISSARAITLLIGEAGTGKTTLLRSALAEAAAGSNYVLVTNPTLTRSEFLRLLATGLGLSADAVTSKAAWLAEAEALLRERRLKGQITALLVDEAQSMPDELLEEVRLLSNIETDTEKLLPIVLIGQPELADRINTAPLRQLKQRIALRCQLSALDLSGTASYIATRLQLAGGVPTNTFTREAVVAIHEASRGIPRTINVLCDNALLTGFTAGERPVGSRLVAEVCRDFGVTMTVATGETPSAAAAAGAEPHRGAVVVDASPDDAAQPAMVTGRAMFASVGSSPRRFSFLWMKG